MAFIVETGDGITYASSYVSVSFADSYASDRNITTWSGTTAQKEGWLITATDYVEGKYSHKYKGEQATTSGLGFPRTVGTAYYKDCSFILGVPEELKKAVVEYALLEIGDSLYPESSEAGLSGSSVSVGSISESKSYSNGRSSSTYLTHPKADRYLIGLLRPKGTGRA